jgi:hypothetical protein
MNPLQNSNRQCEHKVWNKFHNSIMYVMFLRKTLGQVDFISKNGTCDAQLV